MQSLIIYSNDKVELGKRVGFLWFEFEPLLSLPISTSNVAPSEYAELFKNTLKENNITIKETEP